MLADKGNRKVHFYPASDIIKANLKGRMDRYREPTRNVQDVMPQTVTISSHFQR
jgi:hypothetical protein